MLIFSRGDVVSILLKAPLEGEKVHLIKYSSVPILLRFEMEITQHEIVFLEPMAKDFLCPSVNGNFSQGKT